MSKHKPVQWVVDKGGIYAVTAGQLTAVVNWPVFHEPEAADAALICAAPDLLAVLEEMELAHTMSDEPVLSRHHLSLIRAAIKKARGAK